MSDTGKRGVCTSDDGRARIISKGCCGRGARYASGVYVTGVTVRGSFEEGPWHGRVLEREGKV